MKPVKRELSDEEAVELLRTVRTRRSWPRPPMAAFWLRLLADACFLASLVSVAVTLLSTHPLFSVTTGTAGVWPWMVSVGLFVAWFVFRLAANRLCLRLRRRVLRGGGIACINCYYTLAGGGNESSEQVCPECREPYRAAEVRKEWAGWQPGVWFY